MATGRVVIKNIASARPLIDTSGASSPMKWSIDQAARTGTVTIDSRLITAVRLTDSATSAFASFDRMLLVTPPGQKLSSMNPTAIADGRANSLTVAKAATGSRTT